MELHIPALKIPVSLGAYEWEKNFHRPAEISLWVHFSAAAAMASDALEDTLDYTALERRVVTVAQARHYNLIETLMSAVAEAALEHPQVREVTVEVKKPGAPAHSGTVALRETFKR